jgi:hypothetical protein
MRPDFESCSGATPRRMKNTARACAGMLAFRLGREPAVRLRECRTAPD